MRSHHSWQKDEEALGCMHAMITGVLHLVCASEDAAQPAGHETAGDSGTGTTEALIG
jgi:hypothetical protein